ncbi:hypothetical protein EGI22_04440 [Lacihabitans sp. LS3-19]|uniref:choice-of-anchor Q domain-containing protein n=1 Tax=Lacihabitans sp. LS3-19 TaxID=2487335 RepID=UPI0020CF982B|nr:choice-of-anchor Q domain-containing protein [Lacihabitans sp. LS3-19]MCP9767147.1 hypothetical protein [Lacihabitans sp. LS3-19]
MKSKAILSLFLTILFSSTIAQKVAIIGARHLNSTEDGVSILALDDLSAGEIYYFTDNNYDHPSNAFIYALDGSNAPIKEGVVKITIQSTIGKGNVIYFKEIAPSSSNTYTFSVTPGTGTVSVQHVSSSGSFSIGDFGESLYIYTDNDEDPANGVTEIHGAFFPGTLAGSSTSSGGPMPATENPISDYPNAVIVHNFPQYDYNLPAYSSGVNRVEFNTSALDRTDITRIELENPANYVYFGNDQDLSTTKFTNFNLSNSNPIVTLTRDFSQLAENSSSNFSYTFTVDSAPATDLVINFSLNGGSTYGIANFGSDFSQTGATTMNTTGGTVTITGGTTSKTVIINPTGDTDLEPDESFLISITPGTGYTAGSPSVAGSIILNDDVLAVVPEVAILGARHYTDNQDGVSEFSFVALKDLVQGEAYFFSSNPFNKSTLLFEDYSTFPSAMKWVVPTGGVNRGDVMVVKKTAPNTFLLTRNGSSSSAGNVSKVSPAKKFFISSFDGYFRAHTDTDDDPFNGIEAIHSQLFTYEVNQGFGGTMPASLDLSTLYPGSVLVDGFSNTSPGRLEYNPSLRPGTSVDQSNFENPSNWLYGQAMQDLSPVPFNNIIISEGAVNPIATIDVNTSQILENSETAVYTFTLGEVATADVIINFSVAGTATYTSDYTVIGSTSFTASAGSITITNGTSSAQLTITPVGDSELEKTENILLTIISGTGYDGGSPGSAEIDILNDDADNATPQLAIIGINHESPESMSLVAVNTISPNSTFYLTPGDLDKGNLSLSGNAKFMFISGDDCIPAGTVFTITGGVSGPLTVSCNGTSGSSACGSATILNHSFSFLDLGTRYYIFQDDDEDQTNGFTQIHSVFHTGGAYPTNHTGGSLQPEENPQSIYSNAIIIDGFPNSLPNKTEFDPTKRGVEVSKAVLENISNYVHGQANSHLNGLNFNILPPLVNTVSNILDDGCGSLRFVIVNAQSGDTIRFDPEINGNSIKLTTGQILIDKNLTVIGNGKDSTIIDAQAFSRIFEVAANVSLNLDSLRLQNGDIRSKVGVAGQGGAIYVKGRLTISNSAFVDNKAVVGGALMSPLNGTADIFIDKSTFTSNSSNTQGAVLGFGSDTLLIKNSTFSGNTSNDDAGVIRSINAGKILLVSSTFSGNSANSLGGLGGLMRDNGSSIEVNGCTIFNNSAQLGGAFYLETNNLSITNSILKNSASGLGQDINIPGGFVLSDLGHNLVYSTDGNHGIIDGNGIDPRLDVLADNGGPTQTHALLCGSPAQNTGTGTLPDQRGIAVFDGIKDIGAFERAVNVNQIENNNITSGPQQFSAEGVLQSSSKITSPQLIEFEAGRAVILEQGFEASTGSVFSAKINAGCL